MNRRKALKLGAGLGVLAGAGIFAGYEILPPRRSGELESVDTLARRLYTSLSDNQRADTCVAYNHPLRQYHNRGVWGGGRAVIFGFNRDQRQILTDLLYSGLSNEGRDRVPEEYFSRWSGVESMRVLICGDPTSSAYQVILTAAHLNLRLGGKSREGAAFGGPQVYGDQRGNNRVGLPGNLYREQFVIAHRMLQSLDSGRRKHALLEEAPVQTKIELQGRHGVFAGIPVQELEPEGKALAHDLVESLLSTYPPGDVSYARECLVANGGMDALFLSYYQHGMDGDSPLSVGEPLGTNPAWLDHSGVKMLFETALRAETGSDLSYYNESSVAGRLRPGPVHSGDIYSLESWQELVEVVDVRGSNLSTALVTELRKRGITPDLQKTYSVATTSYVANELGEKLGRIESRRRPGLMLRDLTVAYLRSNGFP